MVDGMATVLPLITLALGFAASYLLELFRNRWTTQNTQQIRTAERQQAEHVDRVAFERDGLSAMHAAIGSLLDRVNAVAIAQAKEPAGLDWRESDSGQEPRAAAMHATVRCSHESALLLHPPVIEVVVERLTAAAYPMYWTRESGRDTRHGSEFYEAATTATRAIAARLRELYGFTATDG
jgi:hypothetical protein